jgi:hypothetical protein
VKLFFCPIFETGSPVANSSESPDKMYLIRIRAAGWDATCTRFSGLDLFSGVKALGLHHCAQIALVDV